MAEHIHKEAFMLMRYQCCGTYIGGMTVNQPPMARSPGCGHREVIWNSRDGVTPFCMTCPSCGGDLQHVNWGADIYAPEHKPNYGQGVWRDGTADEAERIIRRRMAQYPDGLSAESIDALVRTVRNPDDKGNTEFLRGWPMLYRHGMEGDA